jgi:putative cardiolipin synthase
MKKTMLALSLVATTLMSTNVFAANDNPFISKSTKAHNIVLLNHGLGSLEERLQMIDRAEKFIDVEYFIYRTDKSAKLFTQALVKKARQGVKIRVLLDYFMVKSDFSPYYAHELEKEGVEVKYFNVTATANLFSGQYRNHRKVLLVDGKEAITGGRNIGDEYFDLSAEYNFMDRELHIEGELVEDIQKTFDQTFAAKLSEHVARGVKPKITDARYKRGDDIVLSEQFDSDLKNWQTKVTAAEKFLSDPLDSRIEAEIRTKGKEELAQEYNGVCDQISFHSEYPNIGTKNRKTNRVVKHDIFERINNSKESIMMDSPYFIVNDELGTTLESALARKVKVELLTNSLNSTDAIYVYTVFDSIIPKWLEKGLDSYIFTGHRPKSYEVVEDLAGEARFGVHAKTFIFDHKDVVIGTYNVDPRSANFNSEMIVSCENNKELADAVQKDIDSRLVNSIHLNSQQAIKDAEFYQTDFSKKLVYYILKGPSNWLDYLL